MQHCDAMYSHSQSISSTSPLAMTARKQLSMVLPEPLINAIKLRARSRRQSITAYITRLVEQDLETNHPAEAEAMASRLDQLEQRLAKLERSCL